jgi:hypothetical protein
MKALTVFVLLATAMCARAQTINVSIGEVVWWLGNITAGFGNGAGRAARFNSVEGCAVSRNGTLYLVDSANHVIRRVQPGSNTTESWVGGTLGDAPGYGTAAQFRLPSAIRFLPNESFAFVTSIFAIQRIDMSTGFKDTFAGGANGFADGFGTAARFDALVYDLVIRAATLEMYAVERHRVRKVAITSQVSHFAGSAGGVSGTADGDATTSRFNEPVGIDMDGSTGEMFVGDAFNHRIRHVTLGAIVTTLTGSAGQGFVDGPFAAARFNTPLKVLLDSTLRYLFVIDTGNGAVRRIDRIAGIVVTVVGSQQGVYPHVVSSAEISYEAMIFSAWGLCMDRTTRRMIITQGGDVSYVQFPTLTASLSETQSSSNSRMTKSSTVAQTVTKAISTTNTMSNTVSRIATPTAAAIGTATATLTMTSLQSATVAASEQTASRSASTSHGPELCDDAFCACVGQASLVTTSRNALACARAAAPNCTQLALCNAAYRDCVVDSLSQC